MLYKPTLGLIAAGRYRNHPRYRGCVGHWLLREDAGLVAFDASGYGNNGTLTAGPNWTAGQFGPAVNFDGTDDLISIPDSPSLRFGTAFSLSLWTINNVTPAAYDGIVGKVSNTNWTDGFGLYYLDATTLAFFVENVSNYGDTITITPTVWNHVVGVYNGATVALFLNGKSAGSPQAFTGSITGSVGALELGRLSSNTYNINGKLDDVRVYNRALTPDEVLSLYRDPFLEFRAVRKKIGRASTGTTYTMVHSYGAAGGLTAAPLTRDSQQISSLGTTGGVSSGGAQSATLSSALPQATTFVLTEALSLSQALAFGAAGSLSTAPLARAIQQGLALATAGSVVPGSAQIATLSSALTQAVGLALTESLSLGQILALTTTGGMSSGGTQTAILSSALVQAAALALTESLSIGQIIALGVNASINAQLGRALTTTITLACGVSLAEQHTIIRTVAAALAVQSALAVATTASLESLIVLTQGVLLTPTTRQTATLAVSLVGASTLSALADLLGQIQMSIALTSTGTMTVVERFTAIGQLTLATQTMTSIAAQQTAQAVVLLAQQAGFSVSDALGRDVRVTLTGGAAIAVLTDKLREYLVSVGLAVTGAITVAEQHVLALRIVETVTTILQAQQSVQVTALIALGVQPTQAVAATATMQMLALIGLQAMLTATAPLVGINAPQIIRLVNEQLLRAMLANEQVGRAQLIDEALTTVTFSDEKIVK